MSWDLCPRLSLPVTWNSPIQYLGDRTRRGRTKYEDSLLASNMLVKPQLLERPLDRGTIRSDSLNPLWFQRLQLSFWRIAQPV